MSNFASNFTQLNLRAIIERANELLHFLKEASIDLDNQYKIADLIREDINVDEWERSAWNLVLMEVNERIIRRDDSSVGSSPKGWCGGLHQPATEDQPFVHHFVLTSAKDCAADPLIVLQLLTKAIKDKDVLALSNLSAIITGVQFRT